VYWVRLDPTVGYEIRKTRPCIVISPDVANNALGTVIVAPLTSKIHDLPCRLSVRFKNTESEIALDQMRCVDKSRLVKPMGRLSGDAADDLLDVLAEMFAP